MVIFDAHAAGTSRAVWDAAPRLAEVPSVDLSTIGDLVVVAAHPDDETLGAGGLIAQAAARGIPVRVIVVTDGAASHPASPTVSPAALRVRRAEEVRDAVRHLAPAAGVQLLGFADGRTLDDETDISPALAAALADAADAHILAPWPGDGHRDHRVVGALVERVAPTTATLWGYPIWMWHWAEPSSPEIPWARALAVTLSAQAQACKQEALELFDSQVRPLSDAAGDETVLDAAFLEHFTGRRELFFAAGPRTGEARP